MGEISSNSVVVEMFLHLLNLHFVLLNDDFHSSIQIHLSTKITFLFGRFSMNPSPPQYASGLMDPQTTKHSVLVLVVMIESSRATPPCRLELKSLPIRCNGLGLGDPNKTTGENGGKRWHGVSSIGGMK